MNHIEAKIENLQRQMLIASDRISRLENFTQPLAQPPDQNQCFGQACPAPEPSPHQKAASEPAELNYVAHLQSKIKELKEERETFLSNAVGSNQHINELSNELQRVRKERDAFKFESDNQFRAWKEIQMFIPNVPGLSLVGMVRRHVEELTAELAALKSNNRYQSGYSDGHTAALAQLQEAVLGLRA